jgi:hypothetical protein
MSTAHALGLPIEAVRARGRADSRRPVQPHKTHYWLSLFPWVSPQKDMFQFFDNHNLTTLAYEEFSRALSHTLKVRLVAHYPLVFLRPR